MERNKLGEVAHDGRGEYQSRWGIILAGENWYSPLFIEMDLETEGAFQVETISLLAGSVIGKDCQVDIHTDCRGAMAAEKKKNKEFGRILGNWKRGDGVNIKKVKAHPERREGEWDKNDEGIYLADLVASGDGGNVPTLSAKTIIGEIARGGKIMICGEDGEHFIGNLRKRCSRENMRRY